MPGENADGTVDDLDQAALDLAAFVKALREVDTTGAHPQQIVRLPFVLPNAIAEQSRRREERERCCLI